MPCGACQGKPAPLRQICNRKLQYGQTRTDPLGKPGVKCQHMEVSVIFGKRVFGTSADRT